MPRAAPERNEVPGVDLDRRPHRGVRAAEQRAEFDHMTQTSIDGQKRIEASDTMPFEIYREQYVSPARLGFKNHWAEPATAAR